MVCPVVDKLKSLGKLLSNDIVALEMARDQLVLGEMSIGLSDARKSMVSVAFFHSIARMTNIDVNTVRNMFYGALALLIEICAFGLISLCRTDEGTILADLPSPVLIQKNKKEDAQISDHRSTLPIDRNSSSSSGQTNFFKTDVTYRHKSDELRLVNDIKSGVAPPIFNRLKELGYDVSQVRIRALLKELKDEGILVDGKRRSLVLDQHQLTIVKASQ